MRYIALHHIGANNAMYAPGDVIEVEDSYAQRLLQQGSIKPMDAGGATPEPEIRIEARVEDTPRVIATDEFAIVEEPPVIDVMDGVSGGKGAKKRGG